MEKMGLQINEDLSKYIHFPKHMNNFKLMNLLSENTFLKECNS